MEYIRINVKKIDDQEISMIADHFLSGEVLAYPTDTIYGLGCLANNAKAISRIYRLKGRDKKMPVLVLAKSYCTLKRIAYVSTSQDRYIRGFWQPGKRATTFIFRSRGILDQRLESEDGGIAVRIPQAPNIDLHKDYFLTKILKRVDIPLVSTSLNKSGESVLERMSEVKSVFGENAGITVIDAGVLAHRKSSQVIDIRDMKNIKVLRR